MTRKMWLVALAAVVLTVGGAFATMACTHGGAKPNCKQCCKGQDCKDCCQGSCGGCCVS